MLKSIRYLLCVSSIVFLLLGIISQNFNIVLSSIMLLWINNMLYFFEDVPKRIIVGVFNVSFFTLLLSNYFFTMLAGDVWWTDFSPTITLHTLLSIYISLFCLFIGCTVLEYLYKEKVEKDAVLPNDEQKKFLLYIRTASKIMFYITYIFLTVEMVERVVFVQTHGYLALYSDFSSSIPFVGSIANMNITFFLIYLSTMPLKRESKLVVTFYALYLILSLLSGVRGTIVVGLLILIVYAVYRDNFYKGIDSKWIGPKEKILITIITPISLVFLSSFNILRNKTAIKDFSFFGEFMNFFTTQGGSVNVISFGKLYESSLPATNLNYTFGPLISYLQRETFLSSFTGLSRLDDNSVEAALYANNFGKTVTYIADPEMYLLGGGLGTQYIGEVYADFGYLGIAVYSFILGYIISWIPRIAFKKWWTFTIGLHLCLNILYLPRGAAFSFFGTFISLSVWIPIFLTLLIAESIASKHTHRYKHKT